MSDIAYRVCCGTPEFDPLHRVGCPEAARGIEMGEPKTAREVALESRVAELEAEIARLHRAYDFAVTPEVKEQLAAALEDGAYV